MSRATSVISRAPMPRVVRAGVPTRTPEVVIGFSGSHGIMFLFTVMPAFPSASSAIFPVSFFGRRSTSMRWLSVPPETRRRPAPFSPSASTCAFSTMRRWYSLNSGCSASWKATALAAMTCSSGPPWMPGKICELRVFAYCSRQRIMPPRGPRSVLWVVVVTISAYGTGLGWSPAATSPAMWAMSTTRAAPTSFAISANSANRSVRE